MLSLFIFQKSFSCINIVSSIFPFSRKTTIWSANFLRHFLVSLPSNWLSRKELKMQRCCQSNPAALFRDAVAVQGISSDHTSLIRFLAAADLGSAVRVAFTGSRCVWGGGGAWLKRVSVLPPPAADPVSSWGLLCLLQSSSFCESPAQHPTIPCGSEEEQKVE